MNEDFKNKKIVLMGLGLLGRGVGDAAFLARCGARVLVTDKKSAKELAPSVAKLKRHKNIRFRLGRHYLNDFKHCDFVLKAAGVPLDSPYIKEARKNNIPVYMSAALFVKLLPKNVTVIGITGTRGKTTTTALVYEILKAAGRRAHLGGNIRGVSTLALLPKIKPGDYVVLELDSWQLQGFRDLKISPHIAVFTTFLPDHMNYYRGSMRKYFSDKTAIFIFQNTNILKYKNTFIVGEQVAPFVKKWTPKQTRRAQVVSEKNIPRTWRLSVPGEHNRYNAACALAVADALGIRRVVAKKAIETFTGVPGRLELVREYKGIKIYNDTTATTPEATIAALQALNPKSKTLNPKQIQNSKSKIQNKKIILIAGGADKGLDTGALPREIIKYCKSVIFLAGTGTDKFLISNFQFLNKFKIEETKILKDALYHAMQNAQKGDIILFSPAFASFGMFVNEYDRGEQFVKLIKKLQ